MKKLIVHRDLITPKATLSVWDLKSDNNESLFECFGCEPPGEPTNELNNDKPLLPGLYNASYYYSPRFKRILARLWSDDPKNFLSWDKAAAIHTGNTDADTHSCLLPGKTRNEIGVWQSKVAFDELNTYLPNPKCYLDKNNNTKLDENGKPLVAFLVEIV